jgi:hypothetical protein
VVESSVGAWQSVKAPIGLFLMALAQLSPKVSSGICTSSKQGLEEGELRKTER